jgi:hypothetical protein
MTSTIDRDGEWFGASAPCSKPPVAVRRHGPKARDSSIVLEPFARRLLRAIDRRIGYTTKKHWLPAPVENTPTIDALIAKGLLVEEVVTIQAGREAIRIRGLRVTEFGESVSESNACRQAVMEFK